MSDYNDAERKRQEAEVEREDHELRRRIAEGGPDQHVPGDIVSPPGRYEAEQERKAAEERRSQQAHTMYTRVATLIALPLAFVALIPPVIGLVLLNRTTDRLDGVSKENREAVELLCGVVDEFGGVMRAAADQIKTSRMNGTYERLVERGLLTEANVAAAIETEKRYRATYQRLANPVACNRIKEEEE